jgi:DNA-nicking Smr family endonuclease
MSKTRQSSGGQGRAITSDEARLWQEATRSLQRVKSKPRVTTSVPPVAKRVEPTRPQEAAAGEKRASVGIRVAAALDVLDRRQARRIAAGKTDIDGRIDLHGLRQAEAHARLRAFLHDAYARGLKTVLVITGKGVTRDRLEHASGAIAETERGVLRRSVPLWLAREDLSQIVLSYAAAGTRHGGAGAFYVRLRSSARSA